MDQPYGTGIQAESGYEDDIKLTIDLSGVSSGHDGGAAPVAPPTPESLVSDLRPSSGYGGPGPRTDGPDYGLGPEWGSTWRWTKQGWVDREDDLPVWRPIVATTDELSNWVVDSYLGIVTGDAAMRDAGDARTLGDALARARTIAMNGLIDAVIARGAHGIIGTKLEYTSLPGRMLVSATGTAETLRER
jgi:uncharacterized protein YbjQ (UPF0145 family)